VLSLSKKAMSLGTMRGIPSPPKPHTARNPCLSLMPIINASPPQPSRVKHTQPPTHTLRAGSRCSPHQVELLPQVLSLIDKGATTQCCTTHSLTQVHDSIPPPPFPIPRNTSTTPLSHTHPNTHAPTPHTPTNPQLPPYAHSPS
jgi:hypothetical protein